MKRRLFIIHGIKLFSVCSSLLLVEACSTAQSDRSKSTMNPNDPCSDLSGVTEADIKAREGLGYVAQSPQTHQYCNNCKHWLPPQNDNPCGNCLLFKGPVHPEGYCTYWETVDTH